MFTETELEPNQKPTTELFFTFVKPYFEKVLNSIEFKLNSIFYTTHLIMKKKYNCENFGRKDLLLTMEQFLFEIRNLDIMIKTFFQ